MLFRLLSYYKPNLIKWIQFKFYSQVARFFYDDLLHFSSISR